MNLYKRDNHVTELSRLSLLYKLTRFFIYFLFLSDERLMLETLDHTIRIGSTPTILYFDLFTEIYMYILIYINITDCYHFDYVT